MIKAICKYYLLLFPPIARSAVNFSLLGFMNGLGVDYYHADVENILFESNEVINKTFCI